jgi:hypothetical protein
VSVSLAALRDCSCPEAVVKPPVAGGDVMACRFCARMLARAHRASPESKWPADEASDVRRLAGRLRPPGDRFGVNRSPGGARSGEVEAIEVHDLGPRSHEVTHERLLCVVTRVDLRDGSELVV